MAAVSSADWTLLRSALAKPLRPNTDIGGQRSLFRLRYILDP